MSILLIYKPITRHNAAASYLSRGEDYYLKDAVADFSVR